MPDGKERMRIVDLELPKCEFIDVMKKSYTEFAEHIRKVKKQYSSVKEMKEKLPVNHTLVQMDFSEN